MISNLISPYLSVSPKPNGSPSSLPSRPNRYGIYEVKDIDAFIIEKIPIKKFPGVGKGFQERLGKHYISTLGEVKAKKKLFYSWKKPGIQLYHRITGT